jgi:hypothetical protein
MSNRYLDVKDVQKGRTMTINIPGVDSIKLNQKEDGTLEGSRFEGQSLEGFIIGVRALMHTTLIKQRACSDYEKRIKECLAVIDLIDKLVEEHNKIAKCKLIITNTFE